MSEEEGFFGRWSRRKSQALEEEQAQPVEEATPLIEPEEASETAQEAPPTTAETVEINELTDEDMPPIESLNEDSDYAGFMSPKVSEELRKIALRKLFSGAGFNVRDGLDDYDEDFSLSQFEPLGDIITSDMKHQMEVEAERKLREALEAEDTPEADTEAVDSETVEDTEQDATDDETDLEQDSVEPIKNVEDDMAPADNTIQEPKHD